MGTTSKATTIILTLIIVTSSLLLIPLVNAQTIPKPSVPEFTLKYVSHSYDVPPETTIDPYTGKNIITNSGYRVENKSVEVQIKNQPFTPYWLDSSQQQWIMLFYNISYKGHYGTDWNYYVYNQSSEWFFTQSASEYTTIPFREIPSEGGEIDFSVQAQIGYYSDYIVLGLSIHSCRETSGWSKTQTITIPDGSVSTSTPNPTPLNPTNTPTSANSNDNLISVPLDTLIVVVAVFLAIIAVLSLLLFRMHRKTPVPI